MSERQRRPFSAGDGRRRFSLTEVAFAAVIISIALGGLFVANSRILQLLRYKRETIAATQSFQERMEKIRSMSLSQLTDATYLQNNVLNANAQSSAILGSPSETITISAYPADASPQILLTRQNGTTTLVSSNANLANGSLVRVDLQLSWTSANGRSRTRYTSTVFGKGNMSL